MKMKNKTYQPRRDFKAIFECQGCGEEEERWGYDDRYFYDVTMPKLPCKKCGATTLSLGLDPEHTATRYAEGQVI
jgi:hypothetical protein